MIEFLKYHQEYEQNQLQIRLRLHSEDIRVYRWSRWTKDTRRDGLPDLWLWNTAVHHKSRRCVYLFKKILSFLNFRYDLGTKVLNKVGKLRKHHQFIGIFPTKKGTFDHKSTNQPKPPEETLRRLILFVYKVLLVSNKPLGEN